MMSEISETLFRGKMFQIFAEHGTKSEFTAECRKYSISVDPFKINDFLVI